MLGGLPEGWGVHPEVGHSEEPDVGALEALLYQDRQQTALVLGLRLGGLCACSRPPLDLGQASFHSQQKVGCTNYM